MKEPVNETAGVLGWWFGDDLLHGDGRTPVAGETLSVEGEPVLCIRGLHASERPLDALRYAPSSTVWRVRLTDGVLRGEDKMVARKRAHLWKVEAGDTILQAFARWCALEVAHLWDAPEVVLEYLRSGDPELRADARDAATRFAAWAERPSAWDATRGDAWNATRAAAWAARFATRDVVDLDVARDAARAAARSSAWDVAWAIWDAAWDVARNAFWDRASDKLEGLIMAEAGLPR